MVAERLRLRHGTVEVRSQVVSQTSRQLCGEARGQACGQGCCDDPDAPSRLQAGQEPEARGQSGGPRRTGRDWHVRCARSAPPGGQVARIAARPGDRRAVRPRPPRPDRAHPALDDPRLTPDEDADLRRRLREEITTLWRTTELRLAAPTPLDEVRTAMAFFDETLFRVVPQLYRALDQALDAILRPPARDRSVDLATAAPPASDAGRTGTRPPVVPAFLRWGSWIGGDRDGNPSVTAEATVQSVRIQADHVLHGYENVTLRLMQSISPIVPEGRLARPLARRLARDADELPDLMRQLDRRFPGEPYRRRLGAMAERLRRTRARLTGQAAAL